MKTILIKPSGMSYDISECISKKKWSGKKTAAQRGLSFEFVISKDVDIDFGDEVILYGDNNVELYRGHVYSRNYSLKKTRSIKTFDIMVYLSRNKDSFTFKNMSADKIFLQIASQFQLPVGEIASTGYVIPSLIASKRDLYSIILLALSETYKQTGERFYLRAMKGKIHLIKRKENVHNWVLETDRNIISASMNESISKMATQVKIYSKHKQKEIVATSKDEELIKKFGIFQHLENQSGDMNEAQLAERAKTLLKQKSVVAKTFSITTIGIDDVISGDCIYVNIPEMNVKRAYYVDSDNHSYDGEKKTMSLSLKETLEF